jgi:DNA-directed RNA polymerase subunit beta'
VNAFVPEKIGFINDVIGKKQLANIVRDILEFYGQEKTARILDEIKDLGFASATKFGFSWGMGELPDIKEKKAIIEEGDRKVQEVESFFAQGLLTQGERHVQIIKIWTDVKDQIEELSKKSLPLGSSAQTMIESGARGAWGQLTQMVGMIGMKASPSGDIIELPVKSSFKDGVDVLEFFISSHGIRKGLTDTALKTANAGYLTRRLVDVSQDVTVHDEDCQDEEGVVMTHKESEEIGEPLLVRILGRYTLDDIVMPGGRKVIVKAGELIKEDHVRELKTAKKELDSAHVRSVMTCKARRGICQKCYGYDLAYNKLVKLGTSVGIIAAQSIGEPGTQLTMRTFHTGGVAGKDITQGLPRVEELFEARMPKRKAIMTEVSGKVEVEEAERSVEQAGTGKQITDTRPGQKIVRIRYTATDERTYLIGRGGKITVKEGEKVSKGDVLGALSTGEKILCENEGVVSSVAKTKLVVVFEGQKIREYVIPQGYSLYVKTGDEVRAGDVLTEGHLDLQALYKYQGKEAVKRYLSKEILAIYASQGQKLNNKHIEIIIRQMFSRVRITIPGDTDFLPGEVIEKTTLYQVIDGLKKGQKAPEYEELFLGITKVSLSTESWLSAASFQETARVLINAAVTGKVDTLSGLKENVIIGRLIPAGTGFNAVLDDGSDEEQEDELIPKEAVAEIEKEIKEEGPGMGTVVVEEEVEEMNAKE